MTIVHMEADGGEVELIFTPETKRLKLQFRGITLSRELTEAERRRLSKALWYAGSKPDRAATT